MASTPATLALKDAGAFGFNVSPSPASRGRRPNRASARVVHRVRRHAGQRRGCTLSSGPTTTSGLLSRAEELSPLRFTIVRPTNLLACSGQHLRPCGLMADVWVCASSITGHVAPMLAIASHLRDAGHAVRMITGSRFGDRVSATGVEILRSAARPTSTTPTSTWPSRTRRGHRDRQGQVRPVPPLPRHHAAAVGPSVRRAGTPALRRCALRDRVHRHRAAARRRRARPPVIGCGIIPLTLASPHVPPFGPGIRYAAGPAARLRHRVLNAALHKVVFAEQQRQAQACLADSLPGQGSRASSWTVSRAPTRSCN